MSDEDFLARWSRRKREATEVAKPNRPNAAAGDAETAPRRKRVLRTRAQTARKPSSIPRRLPPIEFDHRGTDITAFLRPGVPPS